MIFHKLCDSNSNESKMNLYADDAKVYKKLKNETDCSILQQDIEYFQTWADTWLLKLNITKCKVVSYAKRSMIENKIILCHRRRRE